MRSYSDACEELAWKTVKPDHCWILDKLQLARRLGYICGPCGTPVPTPGTYVVRPTVNPFGMERSTKFLELTDNTDHLLPGHFWCEKFLGSHLTIDLYWGEPAFSAIGTKENRRFTSWKILEKSPNLSNTNINQTLLDILSQYPVSNLELINGNIIEIHLRANPDFLYENTEFIPVYDDSTKHPFGYKYIECPEENGRIGAFIK